MGLVIETERLTLSPLQAGDAAFLLELLNDPGWLRNIGDRNVHSLEDAQRYIVQRLSKSTWFVVRDAGRTPLGMCGLVDRDGLDWPDIGYAYLERHSGQGYATEAATAVLRHAREAMGLARVCAITAPDNLASRKVLEKIGLQYVETIDLPGYDTPSAYFTT